MWRMMCDSDNPADLLPTELAATYTDVITTQAQWLELRARLPRTKILLIDRALGDPLGLATIADVEAHAVSGASLRAKITGWINDRRPYPTAYHDLSRAAEISRDLAGVAHWRWLAWPGHLEAGGHHPAAVQFEWSTTLDRHVDLSVVHDPGWNPTTTHAAWVTGALSGVRAAITDLSDVAATLAVHQR